MPVVNITLKDGAPDDELKLAKQRVTDQGGKIVKEFTLIKGFTAEIPDNLFSVLSSSEHVDVETDGVVTTQ